MPASQTFSRTQHPSEVAEACQYLIRRDADSPLSLAISRAVLSDHLLPTWDTTGQDVPRALHEWVRHEIRFVREPHKEYVASLDFTYLYKAGDCDDMAVAIGTIARSVGVPTWVCWRWTGPGFAHVYPCLGPSWAPGQSSRWPTWSVDPFLEKISRDLGPPGLVHLLRC